MPVRRRRGGVTGPEKANDFPKVTQPAANLGPEPNLLALCPVLWPSREAMSPQSSQDMERGPGRGLAHMPASGRGGVDLCPASQWQGE